MTRNQKIEQQAAFAFSSNKQLQYAFAQGARWADYNTKPMKLYVVTYTEWENDKVITNDVCEVFEDRHEAIDYVNELYQTVKNTLSDIDYDDKGQQWFDIKAYDMEIICGIAEKDLVLSDK